MTSGWGFGPDLQHHDPDSVRAAHDRRVSRLHRMSGPTRPWERVALRIAGILVLLALVAIGVALAGR